MLKRNFFAITVSATLAPVSMTLAQTGQGAVELPSLVVTAEKIERSTQETLTSVGVVTDEDIRARNDQSLSDVLVRNLFDERYITNNQPGQVLDAGEPRFFGVELRSSF